VGFQRLLRMTKKLTNPKVVSWKQPPKADLVVYDQVGSHDLGKIVFPDLKYWAFPVRGEFFYFHPWILVKTIGIWLTKKVTPRQAYEVACLKAAGAKVVVTYIDNNPNIGMVARVFEKSTFVIQNGFRTHDCANRISELPNLFCFGKREIDLYASHHIPVENFHPVGSIKASYFLEEIAPQYEAGSAYDICLISSYQPGMENPDFSEPEEYRKSLVEGTLKACQYLARLQTEKGLRIVVAGWQKPGEDQGELKFYQQQFGDRVQVISAHKEYLSSYRLAYQSRVVLSYCSTLGYEALSWGHKAFFFYMPQEKNYRLDQPHSALFQIRDASYEEFCGKLNTILEMPDDKYQEEVQKDTAYVMEKGKEPAYQLLRRLIQQALEGSKPSG
jgi:surface carbohydrate biosynthesis protein